MIYNLTYLKRVMKPAQIPPFPGVIHRQSLIHTSFRKKKVVHIYKKRTANGVKTGKNCGCPPLFRLTLCWLQFIIKEYDGIKIPWSLPLLRQASREKQSREANREGAKG